jgi:hypothetical protein
MNWRRHNRPNYRPWLRQPVTFGKAVIPHIDFQDGVPRRFLPAAREYSDWGLAASAIGPLFSSLTCRVASTGTWQTLFLEPRAHDFKGRPT